MNTGSSRQLPADEFCGILRTPSVFAPACLASKVILASTSHQVALAKPIWTVLLVPLSSVAAWSGGRVLL